VLYPLALGGVSIVASIISVFFVKLDAQKRIMRALYKGLIASAVIALIAFYFVTRYFFPDGLIVNGVVHSSSFIYLSAVIGILVTASIFWITEFYTSTNYPAVKKIAKASTTGHATNIITGLAISKSSTALMTIVISVGILISYYCAGIYGIAIAAVSMLSLTGIVVAMDAFGPITDNAGGIAEMAEMEEAVRKVTDPLDAVGNTTKAVTKGYAIGSAGLAAVILFTSYTQELHAHLSKLGLEFNDSAFSLSNPLVIVGLLIGGMIPYYFAARCLRAVGKAGGAVVKEVRRQFNEIKGIMTGEAKPDYAACVDIVTKAAIKR